MTQTAPHLILINGTSSTGKTTLARKLQTIWTKPLIYLGIDNWVTMTLAEKYWEPATRLADIKQDTHVRQGTHFLLPNTPENPTPWPKIGSGPVTDQIIYSMHDTALQFLAKGIDVVLDHVLLKPEWRDDFLAKTQTTPRLLVQMVCAEEILEAREIARQNRMQNVFRSLLTIAHEGMTYDIALDSSQLTPDEAAQKIVTLIGVR
jgi:chloramphenicol 3-O phosphotransferase